MELSGGRARAACYALIAGDTPTWQDQKVNTPTRPPSNWWIWLLAVGVVIGYPASAFVYYPLLLQTGTLPTGADSIGIPMGMSIIVAGLASPFVALLTYVCTRRRASRLALLAWNKQRPIFSSLVSFLAILPIVIVVYDVCWMFIRADREAIDAAWVPHEMIIATWFIILRGSILGRFWQAGRFGETTLLTLVDHPPYRLPALKNGRVPTM